MTGLNKHGCVFLIQFNRVFDNVTRTPETLTEVYGTLDGLRTAVVLKCQRQHEEDPCMEEYLSELMLWAEETPPGSVQSFFDVLWIFSLHLDHDPDDLLELLDHDEWKALGGRERQKN